MHEGFLSQPQLAVVRAGDASAADIDAYWTGLIACGEGVILEGVHYLVGPEDAVLKGYGGRRHRLTARDGVVTETTNLWCQGVIPEAYRAQLPDTLCAMQVEYGYGNFLDVLRID